MNPNQQFQNLQNRIQAKERQILEEYGYQHNLNQEDMRLAQIAYAQRLGLNFQQLPPPPPPPPPLPVFQPPFTPYLPPYQRY